MPSEAWSNLFCHGLYHMVVQQEYIACSVNYLSNIFYREV